MNGNIYFIRPIGMDGPLKIGFSIEPKFRLDTFSTWSPFPLEIIGTVPGSLKDETFLHQCFADLHTHREWFLSTPALRNAIHLILEHGTVDAVRGLLVPKDGIKNRSRKPRSPEEKMRIGYVMRISGAKRKLEGVRALDENGAWYTPDDINEIMQRWSPGPYEKRQTPQPPTRQEILRIEEFIADPIKHAVTPPWTRRDNVVSLRNTGTA